MSLVGFEPTISAGKRSQTYVLDRAATGTDYVLYLVVENNVQTLKRITMDKFNRQENDVKLC